MSNVLRWLKFYLYGLFAQSFNGALTGMTGIGVMAETGKLPEGVTLHILLHSFGIGLATHAFLYFYSHPLPEQLPQTTPPFPPPSRYDSVPRP